jgi:hypothetical protein
MCRRVFVYTAYTRSNEGVVQPGVVPKEVRHASTPLCRSQAERVCCTPQNRATVTVMPRLSQANCDCVCLLASICPDSGQLYGKLCLAIFLSSYLRRLKNLKIYSHKREGLFVKFEGSAKYNNPCVSKQVSQDYSIKETSFHTLKQIFRYQSVPNYSQKWTKIHFDARTLRPEKGFICLKSIDLFRPLIIHFLFIDPITNVILDREVYQVFQLMYLVLIFNR